MAYAALVSLAQTINQILNQDHTSINLPSEIQEVIRSIREHTVDLQLFLNKFPKIDNSLEGEIREVANTAEDVIEYLVSEKNPSDCGSIKPTVGVSNSAKFEKQLKEVAEKLKSTARDVVDYIKNDSVNNVQRLSDSSAAVSSSSKRRRINTDIVIGFEKDMIDIMEVLTHPSTGLQVLPIVGMGGAGKTALAKLVYRHALMIEHFDIRGWVTVSQDYNVASIVSNLLASMRGIQIERDVEGKISSEDKIHKYIRDRRYLIVVDDMWSKRVWDDVRKLFPDNDNGSRIILTTRLQDVAAYAGPSNSSHMVRPLAEDASWLLLKFKVFGYEYCPPKLVVSGRDIVAPCRGLPLLIVVVAGLLSKIDETVDAWRQIAMNDWQLETIMSLSYIHLPHHLKSCFLYMGGFPEDHQIRVSELIKLWVAAFYMQTDLKA